MRYLLLAMVLFVASPAFSQQLVVNSVSVSRLGKASLCSALGGNGQPPTITIRHSKGSGELSISMIDNLSNGNVVNHGSTSVSANPSGITSVNYAFLPPCNRITARGVTSTYSVSVSAGGAQKTVIWGRYP